MDKTNWTHGRLNRRTLLRGAALGSAGLAGAAIIGCGEDDEEPAATASATASGTSAGTATATMDPSAPQAGGKITVGWFRNQFPQLGVVANGGHGSQMAQWSTNADQYVYGKADGEVIPMLFESWEWVDDQSLSAKLRPGLKFQDDTPLDSEAVKWTIETLKDPERSPRYNTFRGLLATVESVEPVDETNLIINLNQVDAGFIYNFTASPGVPFSRAQLEKLGDAEAQEPRFHGPFTVMDAEDNVGWRSPKFDGYWGGPENFQSYLDEIEWKIITSNETRAAAVQAGDVDLALWSEADSNVKQIISDGDLQVVLHDALPHALSINHVAAPLDDLRVRQAASHAVDRDKVLQTNFAGLGDPWFSIILPDVPGAKDSDPYPFDLAKAKELLTAAGYSDSKKPKLVYALAGNPPTSIQTQEAALYQEMLNVAGFDVEIQNVPTSGQIDLGEGVAYIQGARIGQRADVFSSWTLRASYAPSYLGFRSTVGEDKEVQDKMHELTFEGRATSDQAERVRIAGEISDLYHQYVMGTIPVCRTRGALVGSDKIGGMDHPELGHPLGNSRPRLLWLKA